MAESIREYLSKLGKRGADATNSQLTPAQRKNKARRAAQARWAKNDERITSALNEVSKNTKALLKKPSAKKVKQEKVS
jgi:phage I-like protein